MDEDYCGIVFCSQSRQEELVYIKFFSSHKEHQKVKPCNMTWAYFLQPANVCRGGDEDLGILTTLNRSERRERSKKAIWLRTSMVQEASYIKSAPWLSTGESSPWKYLPEGTFSPPCSQASQAIGSSPSSLTKPFYRTCVSVIT